MIKSIDIFTTNNFLYLGLYELLSNHHFNVRRFKPESVNMRNLADVLIYNSSELSNMRSLAMVDFIKLNTDIRIITMVPKHIATMNSYSCNEIVVSEKIKKINLVNIILGMPRLNHQKIKLNESEKTVLQLTMDGIPIKNIAYVLNRSVKTVYSIRRTALKKTGVNRVSGLVFAKHMLKEHVVW